MTSLFDNLCHHYNVQPDRRGEAHINCPWCGKETKRGQTHFSFSERGAHCWVCGRGCSLGSLVRQVDGIEEPPTGYRPLPKPTAKRREPWRFDLENEGQYMFANYTGHMEPRLSQWHEYAPTLGLLTIADAHLGFGAFPKWSSSCQHSRLQVPLLCDGKVVGFRARAVECDCPKWLGPSGNPSKFLYNGAAILSGQFGRKVGDRCYIGDCHLRGEGPVWIVENPIDALLLAQGNKRAVATLGVSNWHDAWTEALKGQAVIVAYDNDAPGNGGGTAGRKAWLEAHSKAEPPLNGPKLVSRLQKAGVHAIPYDWEDAPLKTDVGDLLRRPA